MNFVSLSAYVFSVMFKAKTVEKIHADKMLIRSLCKWNVILNSYYFTGSVLATNEKIHLSLLLYFLLFISLLLVKCNRKDCIWLFSGYVLRYKTHKHVSVNNKIFVLYQIFTCSAWRFIPHKRLLLFAILISAYKERFKFLNSFYCCTDLCRRGPSWRCEL